MIKKELLSFKHQIPVSEIDADAFKKAIQNKKVLCSVKKVIDFSNYEVYGTGIGETQN